MTVRHVLAACAAAAVLLLVAGCGSGRRTVTTNETSDPLYQEAKDLERQGRNGEALSDLLKEIDRRGESGAPESHLEAGNLYLNWAHDPFEAYHHFSKFLELRPNDKRADEVRGMREAAMRDVARILHAPPGDQTVSLEQAQEIQQLRQRVHELEAELQALRGGGPANASAAAIPLPADNGAAAAAGGSPISPGPSPAPASPFLQSFGQAAAPAAVAAPVRRPAPTVAPQAPPRAAAPAHPVTSGGRLHTVRPGEKSLWGIAREYYGRSVTAAQVRRIYEANRSVMRSEGDLRAGMVLRIP